MKELEGQIFGPFSIQWISQVESDTLSLSLSHPGFWLDILPPISTDAAISARIIHQQPNVALHFKGLAHSQGILFVATK